VQSSSTYKAGAQKAAELATGIKATAASVRDETREKIAEEQAKKKAGQWMLQLAHDY